MAGYFVGGRLKRLVAVAVSVTAVAACQTASAQVPELPRAPLPDTPVTQPVQEVADQATSTANQVTNQVNQTVNPGGGGGNPPSGGGGGGAAGGGGGGGTPSGGGGDGDGGSGGDDGGGGSDSGSGGSTAAERRAERRADRRAAARRAERRERAQARRGEDRDSGSGDDDDGTGPLRPIRDVVEVIPTPIWVAMGLLALLAGLFFLRAYFVGRRARWLEHERTELKNDLGLLQEALLPDVRERFGGLEASVAYRPAEGPAAGGDFYDVFELGDGRVGIIVGDVCGHGREVVAATVRMRESLHAYLRATGEPRAAVQIAAQTLESDERAELTTVVLAVYDNAHGTLTYACAGHEPPILVGPTAHEPVTVASSPPVGAGLVTGLRQTTVAMPPGSLACFFTDGLVEARMHNDDLLGRERLTAIIEEMGAEASAEALLGKIATTTDRSPDDMAACIVRASEGGTGGGDLRVEEFELDANGGGEKRARAFLEACGVPPAQIETVVKTALAARGEFGGAMLRVRLTSAGGGVTVVPLEQRPLSPGLNGSSPHAAMPAAPPISA
jgi:hypothetical protein